MPVSNPLTLVREGVKAVPAVRYALGVAAIAAALAAARAFFGNSREALLGAAGMLFLMVLLVVFAALAVLAKEHMKLPALVLLWSVLLLSISSAALLASSVFFKYPATFPELVQSVVDSAGSELLLQPPQETRFSEPTIDISRLPNTMLQPVSLDLSEDEIRKELAERGSLTLDGTTLLIGDVGEETSVTLNVYQLKLINGAKILTNGNSLEIVATQLSVSGGSIISFGEKDRSLPPSQPQQPGAAGRSGGRVVLATLKAPEGQLKVLLPGQNGQQGGAGAQGSEGERGRRGRSAADGFGSCRRGGGDGGQGGRGGPGGEGAPGGNGGDGGTLVLRLALASSADAIDFSGPGGKPGPGGTGGAGGRGGPGGRGGSGSTFCGGGHGGPRGDAGPEGSAGSPGSPGQAGEVEINTTA